MHHLALRTVDLERTADHYRTVCGARQRETRPNGSIWLESGGVVLMIEARAEHEPRIPDGSLELLAFPLAAGTSLVDARARLDALGVHVEAETDYTLYFRDPDGRRNALSLYRFA